MNLKLLFIVVLSLAGGTLSAQQVSNFSLNNVLNGKPVSLETYPSCSGVAIIFTSNTCAFDEYYRGRIAKLSNEYSDRVPVLLVNSGIEPGDSEEAMAKKAAQLNLKVPYLSDKDQTLMKQLGASKTPQVFLLKNSSGVFSVVYKGALDDNAQVEADVRHAYLKDAIDILLTNQSIQTPEVRPMGCSIKKKP
ncbi:redoxin domain-containing protein [Chryseolinea sp. T2]|uniref:redoxin domain-containing protein n=1 Tax=Chryseolinea sp. T2 TaxID=3129255 RepID=UPI0030773BB0